MQGIDGLSLYVQSGQSQAMRQLGAAVVHSAVVDRWHRRHGYQVDTCRAGRRLSVVVTIPRRWWMLLGFRHWWIAWQVTRLARRVLQQQAIDLLAKGFCR
jgi:hypothetical protein